MTAELTSKQKAMLRGMAMKLRSLVQIGKQGVTENVVKEISFALLRFELVKVRIDAENREAREALIHEIEGKTDSTLCGTVGSTASFYRQSEKKLIKLD
jgi:RNA-binding protein